MPKVDFRFHYTLRVRWGECDAQGIVFNAQYLNYIEVAHAEYYRNLGVLLYDEESRKRFDVATVNVTLNYIAPAKVDDLLDIYMRVMEIGNSSIKVSVEMHRQTPEEPLTTGEVVYVAYDSDQEKSRPVPDGVRELIIGFEGIG
ncbi:MAG: thioesterase family protein [Chloroflexi bacterium]|nr:thioesterase family protein [Chloroflexota bacterium]MDA1227229.1 thioesterase family protein [Chloroflexota bacterium]